MGWQILSNICSTVLPSFAFYENWMGKLQCRLERMERRMSILKHKDEHVTSPTAIAAPVNQLNLQTHRTPAKRKLESPPETYCKRVAAETCRLLNKPPTPRQRSKTTASGSKNGSKIPKTEPRVPKLEFPSDDTGILTSNEEYHVLPCAAELRSPTLDRPLAKGFGQFKEVEVPTWRVQVFQNIYKMEGTENITDEAYMRRHQKPEMEEKRRKRWDLQRQREQEAYERLREKTYGAGEGSKVDGVTKHSLFPSLNSISHIEICDDLPVSVFGRGVPRHTQMDFELPWTTKITKTPRKK